MSGRRGRCLTFGCVLVDSSREKLCQRRQDRSGRQARLGDDRLDLLVRQQAAQFVSADGQVLAIADPGMDLVGQTGALGLADEHVEAIALEKFANAAAELVAKLPADRAHSLVHEVSEKAAHPCCSVLSDAAFRAAVVLRSPLAAEFLWNFDVDFEHGTATATINLDLDLVLIDGDMACDDFHDFLVKLADQIGLAALTACAAFMGEQDLEPILGDAAGLLATREDVCEKTHELMRPS